MSKYSKKILKEKTVIYCNYELTCDSCGWQTKDEGEPRSISFAHDRMEKHQRQCELNQLLRETDWEECGYPDLGESGWDGSARLKSKEQIEKLIELKKSYEYHYMVEWDGPGKYKMAPSWQHGYGSNYNDILYTATLTKEITT